MIDLDKPVQDNYQPSTTNMTTGMLNASSFASTQEMGEYEQDMRDQYDAAYTAGKVSGRMEGFLYGAFFTCLIILSLWWYFS